MAAPRRLSTKLAYGAGSIALGVKEQGFSALLMIYYNQVLGLPAAWVGMAVMIALAIDSLADPVIGYVSDRWRSRWGRRHPFMYAAALPAGLCYFALWSPPGGLSHQGLFAYLMVLIILVRTFITLHEIPNSSLVVDLSSDYDQRTSYTGVRFFLGWWGALAMSIAAFSLFLRPGADGTPGQLMAAGYHNYSLAAAAVITASILISALGTHHLIPTFRTAAVSNPKRLGQRLGEIGEAVRNRSFLAIAGAGVFGAMGSGLRSALIVYIYTYVWRLTGDQISLLVLSIFPAALVAVFLAPKISARHDKKRAAIGVAALGVLVGVLPYGLWLLDLTPPEGSAAVVAMLCGFTLISNVLGITSSALVASMIADLSEDSEIKTGRRSEGLFFSANSFIQKCVSGVGLFGAGLVLTLVEFPAGARPDAVSEPALRSLILVEVPLVALFAVASMLCLSAYTITRASHAENLRKLAAGGQASAEGEPGVSTQPLLDDPAVGKLT